MDYENEQWIDLPRGAAQTSSRIYAFSSCGRIRYGNGTVKDSPMRQTIQINGKIFRLYHLIADNFLITVRRPEQVQIDHMTSTPKDYAVNDVRNLRYCTQKENVNFPECRERMSSSQWLKGKGYLCTGDKSNQWKGDLATEETKRLRKYRRKKRGLPTDGNPDLVR